MGSLCSCNCNSHDEGKVEFFGFKKVNKINEENKEYWIIKKVKSSNNESNDDRYYGITNDYGDLMINTFPQEKIENDDVKESNKCTIGTLK